jgi:hypothetical protein
MEAAGLGAARSETLTVVSSARGATAVSSARGMATVSCAVGAVESLVI